MKILSGRFNAVAQRVLEALKMSSFQPFYSYFPFSVFSATTQSLLRSKKFILVICREWLVCFGNKEQIPRGVTKSTYL